MCYDHQSLAAMASTSSLICCSSISLLMFGLACMQVSCLQFPRDDCNAEAIIGNKAECRPHPNVEVMMDHITLIGKKLSTIKRLSPSHVVINQCAGRYCTVGNIGNFWLITKSRFIQILGPKKLICFYFSDIFGEVSNFEAKFFTRF